MSKTHGRPLQLVVHQEPPRVNVTASLESALATIRRFAHPVQPTLIVFSELFLGGYGSGATLTSDEVVIQPNKDFGCPESLLARLAAACNESHVGIVIGCVEREIANAVDSLSSATTHYNAAVAIGDDGKLLAVYRKVHLWGEYERQHFVPGNDLLRGRFVFHGMECGIVICFDVEFPESIRTLRLSGAEVVLVPTALVDAFNARITVPSRAFENNCIVCYANEVGPDPFLPNVCYCGLSVASLPDGREAIRLGTSANAETQSSVVDLDDSRFVAARERNNYLECRRPDLYAK